MTRTPILTRRQAAAALATLTCGSGLLTACTSARSRPTATVTRTRTSTPDTPQAMASPTVSAAPLNVYANIAPGMINPKWAHVPVRVYVPNSLSGTVTEIDPRTYRVIRTFPVGAGPNHVTPSWDGSVLWVDNTAGDSLTPIDPRTGRSGSPARVADPYNLYFTPDGSSALVMAENLNRIDFRDPLTMRPRYSMAVPAAGVNHMDFTADGDYALASCEFSATVVWIDIRARKVVSLARELSSRVGPS